MHPIERLRYVARASGVGHDLLARETAGALAAFSDDPAGLVTACRRIVARHPTSGPMWWLASRVLTSVEPMYEAWQAVEELADDPTPNELLHSLEADLTVAVLGWPELVGNVLLRRGDLSVYVVDIHGEGTGLAARLAYSDIEVDEVPAVGLGAAVADADLLLLEASAIGPDQFLSIAGSIAAASVAKTAGIPVWLVGGAGRLMPKRVWEALVSFLPQDEPWYADDEVVSLSLVDAIVGPVGPEGVAEALLRTDTPVAPELFIRL